MHSILLLSLAYGLPVFMNIKYKFFKNTTLYNKKIYL